MKHKLEWPSGHLEEYRPKQDWERTGAELRNKISRILWTKFFNSCKEPSRCKSNSRIAQTESKGRPIKCPKLAAAPPSYLPSFPAHHLILLNSVRDPKIETAMPARLQTLPGSWTACHVHFQSWSVAVLSCFSQIWILVTPWTTPHQALCPWDSPGKKEVPPGYIVKDFPNPRIL